MKETLQELSKLHPAVACVFILAVCAVVCLFIYQFWKSMREH